VRGALLTIMKPHRLDARRGEGSPAALPRAMASAPPDLQVKEFADQSSLCARHGRRGEGSVIAASLTP